MTDRIKTLTVHLDADYRDDDTLGLVAAISHFQKVAKVEMNVSDHADHDARVRVQSEIRERFYDFYRSLFN